MTGADIALNTLTSDDIAESTVHTNDILDATVLSKDLADGSVRTSEVLDNSLTGVDIEETSLSEVPSAADANNLDGLDSSDFARSGQASFTSLGLSDSTIDGTAAATHVLWQDFNPSLCTEVGYWRDDSGIVHLRGMAIKCGNSPDLPFPPGYRPVQTEIVVLPWDPSLLVVTAFISPNDGVRVSSGQPESIISLTGVTFRCGPSGVDGCP